MSDHNYGDCVLRHITRRQSRFVDVYLATWSQVEAARAAGYPFPEHQASRIIKRLPVVEEIKVRMSAMAMQADEVLLRLGQQGKVNISMFFNFSTAPDANDELKQVAEINWEAVRTYGFLIKRIELTRDGWRIEVHDPQKALELIGKHLKLFTDQMDVTSKGESIKQDNDGRDRAISTLADALREVVSRPNAEQASVVGTAEQTSVAGSVESSG